MLEGPLKQVLAIEVRIGHHLIRKYAAMTPKANILIVDDYPENLLALEAVLEDLSQNIVRANSGEEALRQLLKQDFAVVLLDVKMPSMDGFETASLIRQRERSQFTPIIFLTGVERSEEQMRRGYELGAVDYLLKPYLPEVLRWKVTVFVDLYLKTQEVKHFDEIQRLNRELEATNRELEAFSYTVSHDLRAPLDLVTGFAEILQTDFGYCLPEQGQDYLSRLLKNSQRMGQLIEDLLAFSRESRQPLIKRTVTPGEIVTQVVEELEAIYPDYHVDVNVTNLPLCQADPALLRQVYYNLLSNSFKYTSTREKPVVEIGCGEMDGKTVYYVKDNGVGFDMGQADKLFTVFHRLHSAEEFEGTGLGLAIVHQIIRRHGGHIWADAETDHGATFYFTLS
jgi:two-component system, sensor histidine kinase and response regulator